MALFTVITLDTMTHVQEIEADTWQEAEQIAEEYGVPGLCHECAHHWSRDEQNRVIDISDADQKQVAKATVGDIGDVVAAD